MRLLEKIRETAKHLTDGTSPNASEGEQEAKKKAERGFVETVKNEIEIPKDGEASPHEVTVEEVYQDLVQRKQKGEMPRIPAEALMDVLGKPSASEIYASDAVFILSRQYRDHFLKALQTSDAGKLSEVFRATFTLFIDQPEAAGLTETAFNKKSEDTDPMKWNVSCASTANGGNVALCCMPIRSKTLSARLVGIVFNDSGDRYYSCMLNKDKNASSEIVRKTGNLPPEKAGTISGTDPEPMNCFLSCIQADCP